MCHVTKQGSSARTFSFKGSKSTAVLLAAGEKKNIFFIIIFIRENMTQADKEQDNGKEKEKERDKEKDKEQQRGVKRPIAPPTIPEPMQEVRDQ